MVEKILSPKSVFLSLLVIWGGAAPAIWMFLFFYLFSLRAKWRYVVSLQFFYCNCDSCADARRRKVTTLLLQHVAFFYNANFKQVAIPL